MRAPWDVGFRPAPSSMMPAFTISSLNFPMAASMSSVGILPASLSLLALTITMTRIVGLLFVNSLREDDEWDGGKSTYQIGILAVLLLRKELQIWLGLLQRTGVGRALL